MRRLRLFSLIVVSVLALGPATALADTKPYIKAFGGDVMAGGWFNQGASSCSTSGANYQSPTFTPLNNAKNGAILAFATSDRRGSSVDFGALAMGLIEGDSSNNFGFYSGQIASSVSGLSFANTETGITSAYWGGFLAGATQQTHCIPDYYGTKQNTSPPPASVSSSFNIGSLSSGQYAAPNGLTSDITAGGTATIAAGKSVTLFVNGNAYISHNIQYAGGYTADNVPKLAIVVKGNIYIDPAVTQLDGLYIAQPSSGVSDGDIWTCHDSSNVTPDGWWVFSSCNNKLTINGAVIAKQVNFLRINGDLAGAVVNEPASSGNIAEVINYTPSMVMGGSFFSLTPNRNPKINSLISLPPVF